MLLWCSRYRACWPGEVEEVGQLAGIAWVHPYSTVRQLVVQTRQRVLAVAEIVCLLAAWPTLPLAPLLVCVFNRFSNSSHCSFVANAEAEVKSAASGLRTQLAGDQCSLEGSLAAVGSAAGTALACLHTNEGAVAAAHAGATAALVEGGASLGAALQASQRCGGGVRKAAASAAAASAASLAAHAAEVEAEVAEQTASLAQLAATQTAACGTALEGVGSTRATMQAAAEEGLAADGAAGSSLVALSEADSAALAGFTAEQQAALAGLSGLMQQRVGEQYRSDSNRGEQAVPALLCL